MGWDGKGKGKGRPIAWYHSCDLLCGAEAGMGEPVSFCILCLTPLAERHSYLPTAGWTVQYEYQYHQDRGYCLLQSKGLALREAEDLGPLVEPITTANEHLTFSPLFFV